MFNFGDMFILCTKVEADLTKALLKRFKCWVGECGHDPKAMTMIDLNDTIELAAMAGGGLMAWQGLNGSKVKAT